MLDNVGLRYPHRASGAKALRTLRPLPLLRFAVSATGGAHLCSIQYYLRFWPSSCRTSLAVSALRIMRYCLNTAESPIKCKYPYSLKAVRVFLVLKICISPGRNNGVTYLTGKAPGIKFICRGRCSSSARMAGRKWHVTLKYCKRSRAYNARPCGVK